MKKDAIVPPLSQLAFLSRNRDEQEVVTWLPRAVGQCEIVPCILQGLQIKDH